MLVAFQAWIYQTFPSLEGIVVTRISRVHPRIINWMADEQPSTAKLEGPNCFSNPKIVICDLEPLESEMAMPYMNGVQYNKPIQLTSSTESRRRTKRRMERTVEDVGTSGKSVPLVLPLMDSNIGQAHSSDDDDDFVAPPPRWQDPSARGKSPIVEGPTAAHHSQKEPQSHGAQRDDAFEVLRVQVSELQADNKVLKMEFEDIKSHMSSLNEGKTNKMDDIIQMQACCNGEIIRRSSDRTSEHGVGQKEAPEARDQEHHGASGSEKAQEETQKRVDSIISDVVTATKTVENEGSPTAEPALGLLVKRVLRPSRVLQSPFVARQERGKLFKHDDNVVIFEGYGDNVDEVDKSAFMGWFQRRHKLKNK
ncbi:Hypothetical predicted protein [Olea europaea subsp. europaea]|uniref:Uncharacterized protein n=1 Tax=Olea europaea subsp. europaea TaxID=158383 RepID=A0A8S0S1Z4_OLEEU|nr:Hypothetical predicted protein [Olea europaea subsp. europaea]